MERSGRYKVLEEAELQMLVNSYTNSSAIGRLQQGLIGDKPHPLATSFLPNIMNATRTMLRVCAEGGGLVPTFRRRGRFRIPPAQSLPPCRHGRLHLVMLTSQAIKPGASTVNQMWGSFRMRGLALPAALLDRGHTISWYSAREHAHLFHGCANDSSFTLPFPHGPAADGSTVIGVVVKNRPWELTRCFQKHKIPLAMDLIDSSLLLGTMLGMNVLLSTNRISNLVYGMNTGVRSVPVYHQPGNYARFRREDRSGDVKVVAMTQMAGNREGDTAALARLVSRYCSDRGLQFRTGDYSGHGFDQAEMRSFLSGRHDWGSQMGYVMGYSSVDVAILWLPCAVPEMICVKPTTRLASFMSLGIPTIFIGSASYLDIVVEYGYPLVAPTIEAAMELLDLLVRDASLRQAVSELGLRIAERFHLDTIAEEYLRAVCSAAG